MKQLKVDKPKKREGKYMPGLYTSAHDQVVIDKNDVFEPVKVQEFKVVGKIDLDSITTSVRPVVHDPEPIDFIESVIDVTDREEMTRRISEWQPDWSAVRRDIENRNGMSPYMDGDVLQFGNGSRKGIAIGCLDPIRNLVGYYVAMGMYGDFDITKMSNKVMEDGCAAGCWPNGMLYINKANDTQIQMAKAFLFPMIDKERAAFRELLVDEALEKVAVMREQRERRKEEEEREKQEALARIEEQRQQLIEDKERQEEEERMANDVIPADLELDHLSLSRCQKTVRNSNWPRVDQEIPDINYFSAMKELSSIFAQPIPTYVLSRTYVGFCYHEMREQLKEFSTVRNLIGEAEFKNGVLCFQKKLNGEMRDFTVPYSVGSNPNSGTELIRFVIIIDGQMYGTYNHSRKNAFTQPFVTHNRLLSPNAYDYQSFNMKEYCESIINLIICHIMMEQQTEASTRSESECHGDSGNSGKSGESAPDIFLRTAAWYNSVTIPSTEVAPYESHRWKGSGENKTLEPVTVSGYTKGAYTRVAQCEK